MVSGERRRTGRRPGEQNTREQILVAARDSFAANGYDGTTIRGVAGQAGVDPALVHYFFGTKDRLFSAVMDIPVSPAAVTEGLLGDGTDGLGEQLARTFLGLWDSPQTGPALVAMLRSAASHQQSAALVRDFVAREILGRIAGEISLADADLRAGLCGTQLVGVAMLRYVLRHEPIASAAPAEIVRWLGPTLQRYLTGRADE